MLMLQAFLAIGSGENGLSRVKVQFGRINITAKNRWYGRVSIQPSSRCLCLGGPGPTASNKFTPAPSCLRMTTPIRDKSAVADAKHTKHEILAKVTPMLTSGSCSVLVCSLVNLALTPASLNQSLQVAVPDHASSLAPTQNNRRCHS